MEEKVMKKGFIIFTLCLTALTVFAEKFSTYTHCQRDNKLLYFAHFDNRPDTIVLTGDCGNTLFDTDYPIETIRSVINPKNISIDLYNDELSFICGFDKNCGITVDLIVQAQGNTLTAKYDEIDYDGELTTCGSDFDMIKFHCPIPSNGILNLHINTFDTVVNLNSILKEKGYFNKGDTWTEYKLDVTSIPRIVEKYQYHVGNDTTIDGIQYKRIVNHYAGDAVIREFGQKVYARLLSGIYRDKEEFLLYDFSAKKGDVVCRDMDCIPEIEVMDVDSVKLFNGEKRKRINSGWIEGIGCTCGLFDDVFEHATDYTTYSLVCFKQNGDAIYVNEETNLDGRGCEELLPTNEPQVFEPWKETPVFISGQTIRVQLQEKLGEYPTAISVFNSMGILCNRIMVSNPPDVEIDMSGYGAGNYIVTIHYTGRQEYYKVVLF